MHILVILLQFDFPWSRLVLCKLTAETRDLDVRDLDVLSLHHWFPATLEIRENLENEFPIFQSGKTLGIWEKHQNQGKLEELVTVNQKGNVFASLGYVRLVPCVQLVFIDWLVIVAFVTITHLKEKLFLIEFWNFLRENYVQLCLCDWIIKGLGMSSHVCVTG